MQLFDRSGGTGCRAERHGDAKRVLSAFIFVDRYIENLRVKLADHRQFVLSCEFFQFFSKNVIMHFFPEGPFIQKICRVNNWISGGIVFADRIFMCDYHVVFSPLCILHKRLRLFYHCLAFIAIRGQTPPGTCPCLTAPLAGDTLMTSPAGGKTMPLTEKNPLSSNAIKLIAIAAMTVDHIAWAVFPGLPKEFLPMSCISSGASPADHVLLHRRGVSLYAEHPQVYRASLCFRADLAFLLHIFLARFHRLALLYPVLLRRRAQPDERYVVACVGSCDAARRGKQKDHVRAQCGCCSFCLSAL